MPASSCGLRMRKKKQTNLRQPVEPAREGGDGNGDVKSDV